MELRRTDMLMKTAVAGVAASALLASVAFAQTPSATDTTTKAAPSAPMTTSATTDMSTMKGNWRTSKLVGLNVYNDSNESIGSINDLLTDKSGDIKAVVIGVGGFLGIGEHLVAVPMDKVKFVDEPIAYTSASNAPATGARPSSTTTTGAATTAPAAAPKKNPWYPDHAVFSATKDQLKAMTEFKYATE
jgi:sporulation protein YlmC with PRC-barrel domain